MRTHNYQHGGEPDKLFKRFGLPERPVIDLSVNLNWMGPPQIILDRWPEMLESVMKYPSVEGASLKGYYSAKYAIPRDCILPGNGSAELFYRVAEYLQPGKAAVLSPGFFHYENAFKTNNASIEFIPIHQVLQEGKLSLERLSRFVADAELLFLGNPNNPTGDLFPGKELLEFARSHPDKWLLLDEAFMEFVEGSDAFSLLKESVHESNIITFHSLTKFYSLPGVRLGAVISKPDIISKLSAKSPPWMMNSIAERIAPLLLECQKYETDTRKKLSEEKLRLESEYKKLQGTDIRFGAANFAFGEWKNTAELDDLLRFLLQKGLFIRDCRNFTGIHTEAFRFTVGHPEQNELLLHAFQAATEL
jgi:histidinol-phosphate/aromatic aminotransferase/cobyric acid decarboxylase-like protein